MTLPDTILDHQDAVLFIFGRCGQQRFRTWIGLCSGHWVSPPLLRSSAMPDRRRMLRCQGKGGHGCQPTNVVSHLIVSWEPIWILIKLLATIVGYQTPYNMINKMLSIINLLEPSWSSGHRLIGCPLE